MRRDLLILLICTALVGRPLPALAECEAPGERSTILLSVAQAEQSFRQMDIDGFRAARDNALGELPCLVDPLQPADAARIHVLGALDAFTRSAEADTVNALRSAVRADPAYSLPADLVPEGHALRLRLQVALTVADVPLLALPTPQRGALLVDGSEASLAPSDRPFILQHLDQVGAVLATAYVPARGDLPLWTSPPPPATTLGLEIEPPPSRPTRPWGWVSAAGAGAVATGVLWGLTATSHSTFMSDETSYEDLGELRSRTNTVAGFAIGTAALTAGFGTIAVLRW